MTALTTPAARAALLLLSAVTLASGCKKSEAPVEGRRVSCVCTYLTDYDDTAQVTVEVCVPNGKSIEQEAAQCATESAHNHIDKCACQPPGEACAASAPDACKNF